MNFFKKIKKHIISLTLVILLIVFAYSSLPNTFFQQDEWQFFAGNIYYESKGIGGVIESFFPIDAISHFNPLGMTYTWITYFLFGINFTPYGWLSIVLHIFNALLLYYFVFSWLRIRKIGFIAALFIGLNSIPYQAVTWVAAANSYEIPVAFILLSLIFFQRFLTHNKHRRINIVLSLTMLFISLLFHENGIFLFLFYPIIFFLSADSQRKKILRFFSYSLVIFALIYFLVRIPFFFGFTTSLPELTDISHPPISVYPYRIISIGMKTFAGSLIPEKTLITISEEVIRLAYPQFVATDNAVNPYISQLIVFDLVSYILTAFILTILFLLIRFLSDILRKEKFKNIFVWTLLFVPISLLPYAFVLGKAGYASIIEPKFFYVGSIGISILVAILFYSLLNKFSKQKILKIIVVIIFGLYLLSHIQAIRANVNNLVVMGARIKMFLNEIKNSYQKLPQKIIFFTQSDTAYYGMPDNEKMLPTQVGFGKMLMVWYQKEERFPGCLYQDQFLLNLLEEGYRYCEGRGFGYFRDYKKLVKSVRVNNVPLENIISYSWNSKTQEFKDVSSLVRNKLTRDINNETRK